MHKVRLASLIGSLTVLACLLVAAPVAQTREQSFDERIAAQRAIEGVYWSHRTWPSRPMPPQRTGRVDGRDLVVLAATWNSCPGDPQYDAGANLDRLATPDGACVDDRDFHAFMNPFGRSWL